MIRSNRADLLGRLKTRFSLLFDRGTPALGLQPDIVPVSSFDELLVTSRRVRSTLDLSGTAGNFVTVSALTVPDGKRWKVDHAWRQASTGTTQMAVQQKGATVTTYVRLGVIASVEAVFTPPRLVLQQGDALGLLGDANVSDTQVQLEAWVEEEDAF